MSTYEVFLHLKLGHSTMIGSRSKKVLDYRVKCKQCRKCNTAKKKTHFCARNWSGSAKAMEPAMGVEMCKNLKGINIYIY